MREIQFHGDRAWAPFGVAGSKPGLLTHARFPPILSRVGGALNFSLESIMNNQLVPVFAGSIQGQTVQLVDARLLHDFLGVVSRFADWIKNRINEYEFAKDQDYVEVFLKNEKNPKGGRPSIDYHLTLDMAKELSMVERNEKGRQARRYFIECERQALAFQSPALPEPDAKPAFPALQPLDPHEKEYAGTHERARWLCQLIGWADALRRDCGVPVAGVQERLTLLVNDALDRREAAKPSPLSISLSGRPGRTLVTTRADGTATVEPLGDSAVVDKTGIDSVRELIRAGYYVIPRALLLSRLGLDKPIWLLPWNPEEKA